MGMRPQRALAILMAAAVLAVGACSSDDDSAETTGSDDGTEQATGGNGNDGGTDGTCEGTSLGGSLPGDDEFLGTSAVAVSIENGAAYTVYVTDGEIDPDSVGGFSSPSAPEGASLVTIAVTVFNATEPALPLQVGETVRYTSDFGVLTFRVTSETAGEMAGNSTDAEGQLNITAVGDTFCAEVQYEDGEKQLSGSVEATVVAEI